MKSSISSLLYESNVPVVNSEKRCEDEKRSAIVRAGRIAISNR